MPDAGAPVESADVTTIEDYTTGKPLVILSQNSAQSISSGVDTAIQWNAGSTVLDTHNFHDETTNNSRITPNVAGWYAMVGTYFAAADNDFTTLAVSLRQNGSTTLKWERVGPNTTSASRSVTVSWIAQFNGSTDYVEVIASQANTSAGSNSTPAPGSFAPKFHMVFERPL